ncbi:MAG: hypothetical protein K2Y16_06790 [Burkholderiales bacterium]|nr:hypothetical protein [Burkholderiales bacterium]
MMSTMKRPEQEAWHQEAKECAGQIGETMQRLLERNHGNLHLSGRLQELKTLQEASAQTRDNQLVPLIYDGKIEQARTLALCIQEERYHKMRDIARELGKAAVEKTRAAVAESELKVQQTILAFVIAGVLAMLLAVAMIENLRRAMREVREDVGVLASSSSEILATTTQVASGAAETATAVNGISPPVKGG